jgi:hypothetical protein
VISVLLHTITAYPTREKFELYEWLAQQGWHADRDYWMGFHGATREFKLSMRFVDPSKAAIFKLAWNGR